MVFTKRPLRILIVDDDEADAYMVSEEIENHVVVVEHYMSCALNRLKKEHFDLIITDISLPDSFGLKNIDKLKSYAPVLVMSGIGNGKMTAAAKRHGALGFICKNNLKAINWFVDSKTEPGHAQ